MNGGHYLAVEFGLGIASCFLCLKDDAVVASIERIFDTRAVLSAPEGAARLDVRWGDSGYVVEAGGDSARADEEAEVIGFVDAASEAHLRDVVSTDVLTIHSSAAAATTAARLRSSWPAREKPHWSCRSRKLAPGFWGTNLGMRTSGHGPVRLLAPLALLLCVAMALGCSSNIDGQGELRGEDMKTNKGSDIVELAPQGSALEYVAPDADSWGRVSVSLPKEYERRESIEAYETADGSQIELSTTTVRMGDAGFDLQVAVDDAGYLGWWCNGAVAEYVERATAERLNSSWPISVDGREGAVLVQGSADAGGEISGDAFVFLDGATVWFSAVPVDGAVPEADAYSRFFSSPEVRGLLDSVSLSER